jgi:cytochrome c peroxidase
VRDYFFGFKIACESDEMKKLIIFIYITSLSIFSHVGWSIAEEAQELKQAEMFRAESLYEPIHPLPDVPELNTRIVALGRKLFHDKRLSKDDSIACSSCHDLALGGTDRQIHSIGVGGIVGPINAPTVYNSSLNFVQFWDGRAASLEEQALGPIQNPKEMGLSLEEAVRKISSDKFYEKEFVELFKSPTSAQNIASAIATYEKSLITSNSPFDRFLKGDKSALNSSATEGYNLFKSYGCVACHQGNNIGGNMFQRFGVMGDYFADRGNVTEADNGRYNVTKKESDRFVFKVPSLRNVALTAPYFHDGSAKTLEQAVRVMAKYQLGRTLNNKEIVYLVDFLNSLTGEQVK